MNYYDYDYGYTTSSYDYGTAAAAGISAALIVVWIIALALAVLQIVGLWKTFSKAGKNGWAAIVPYYNNWVLFETGGVKGAYIFFAFIPFVGPIVFLVFYIKALIGIAERFGKSSGFGILSIFFPFVTFLILGFSNCTYQDVQTENSSSILDVNQNGVPNSSDNASFDYGYQNEETVSMDQVEEKQDNQNE